MCKFNPSNKGTRIDPCIKTLVLNLKSLGIDLKASCCGHGRYNLSLIAKDELGFLDLVSGYYIIHRRKKFYKRDKQGYYYIPEVIKQNNKTKALHNK